MSRYSHIVRLGTRALRSPQGKKVGSSVVERAAGLANRIGGDAHAAKIEKARAAAHRGLQRL